MTDESCLRQREGDLDRVAEHARSCPDCARYLRELERVDEAVSMPVDSAPLSIDPRTLPVAPWEGASYRSWTLVISAAISLAVLAGLLFAAAGVGPIEGARGVFRALARGNMLRLAAVFGESLRQAPLQFHLMIVGAFVLVNVLLVRLLRRPPRGADATSR